MIGTQVGSYTITEKVAVGGMGTVYRAEHSLIGKQAAVKVLHPELSHNREVVQRFFNEAKATTQIKHPGIVEIFDFGYMPSGDGFIVMEFLEGESLARRLQHANTIEEGEAVFLMRGVCSALAAAHAKGIIHRDLKPDNIFLCPDPDAPTGVRPKILDFGIAKLNVGLTGPSNATKTGAVMGTPTYMSPEQCKGLGEVDHRADLYSIGCMVYECVAGRPPFENMGAGELIGAHLFMQPEPPRAHGAKISEQTEQLIMSLLAKNPAQRPQTANELARLFGQLAHGHGLITHPTPTAARVAESGPVTGSHVATTKSSTPGVRVPEGHAATLPSMPGTEGVQVAAKPTTLSLAASQSVIRPPRSRIGWFAGIAVVTVLAGGAAVFVAMSSGSKTAAPNAGSSGAASRPLPTTGAPGQPPAAASAPETAPPPTTPPPATPPAIPTTADTTTPATTAAPAETLPATPATKTATKPTKPSRKKPAQPGKPTDKPKPGAGSGSSILIETDI